MTARESSNDFLALLFFLINLMKKQQETGAFETETLKVEKKKKKSLKETPLILGLSFCQTLKRAGLFCQLGLNSEPSFCAFRLCFSELNYPRVIDLGVSASTLKKRVRQRKINIRKL